MNTFPVKRERGKRNMKERILNKTADRRHAEPSSGKKKTKTASNQEKEKPKPVRRTYEDKKKKIINSKAT